MSEKLLSQALTPLEQTARLCKMRFATPYALYGALSAEADVEIKEHASGYRQILIAIRDDRYDFDKANEFEVLSYDDLPIKAEA